MYICQQCGYKSPQFLGKCPECGSWNSFAETIEDNRSSNKNIRTSFEKTEIINLADLKKKDYVRLSTTMEEFDRVLGDGIVAGSIILVSGDPGIGKCVAGSTRILNPVSGDFLPIVDWEKKLQPILALDNEINRLLPRSASAFHKQGKRPVFELKTRLGRTLRCTFNHPVLTAEGWRPVGELSIGTRIATPRGLPFFGKELMDEHEFKLIAYILSDGSAQSSITVTSAIPEVEADLKEIANQFNMVLRTYMKKDNAAKQYRLVLPFGYRAVVRKKIKTALWQVHDKLGISWQAWADAAEVNYSKLNTWKRGNAVPSQAELQRLAEAIDIPINALAPEARNQAEMVSPAARFLSSIGLRAMTAKNKSVPTCIFRLPKTQLALFLKVLFSCDGSVYITKNGAPGISYSTISYRLAQDIQHLLLRFNFIVKLRTKNQKVNGNLYQAYELQMLGISLVKRFLDEIGIWGREKAKLAIKKLLSATLPSTHFDTIPTGPLFWEHLKAVTGGVSLKLVSMKAGATIRYRRLDRPLARTTVSAILKAYPSQYFESLAAGDIYWDEIESITPAGEEQVYDLTVSGVANFVANDLIIHNSTLLTQLALAKQGSLYVAGEESARQIKMRVDRLTHSSGKNMPDLAVLNSTNVDDIIENIKSLKPELVVIDSIQTLETLDLESPAGSVGQVRECAHRLQKSAKQLHIPVILVGHVTKEGNLAGPKALEHLVDVVLSLEGDAYSRLRILRSAKNRFGPTDEAGIFEMEEEGLKEVKNPSKLFLDAKVNAPGSVVTASLSGRRPILVEVQGLVTKSFLPIPRRTGSGIDNNRLQLLIAVLTKRLNLPLFDKDIFVNVTGGLKLNEPAVDLAICMAVISSLNDKIIKPKTVFIGEVGLLGEIRTAARMEAGIKEAKKLGFMCISCQTARNLAEALKIAYD